VRSCEKVENFVKIDGLSLLISNIAATPPTALILSSFSVRDGPTRILFKEKSNPRIRNRERCPIPFHLVVQRSLKEPGVHGVPTGRRCRDQVRMRPIGGENQDFSSRQLERYILDGKIELTSLEIIVQREYNGQISRILRFFFIELITVKVVSMQSGGTINFSQHITAVILCL